MNKASDIGAALVIAAGIGVFVYGTTATLFSEHLVAAAVLWGILTVGLILMGLGKSED